MRTLPWCAGLALATSTFPAPAWAVDWRSPRVVTVSCSGCHTIDGNAESPLMPRLAGQPVDYLNAQMTAYRLARTAPVDWIPFLSTEEQPGARSSPQARMFMIGPAHSADEEDSKAAADWYSKQTPGPRRASAPPDLVARGTKLYAEGVPDENVPACLACHGPDARGRGQFPRLAGQHGTYLSNQIALLASGKRPSPMGPTAHTLSTAETEALVAYLQQL